MKKLGLVILLSCSLLTPFSTNLLLAHSPVMSTTKQTQNYSSTYNTIFSQMKDGMNAAPNTDNINLDFVLEMSPHHQGAIDMSKAIIQYGSNPDVKKIAEHIITSQEAQMPIFENLKTQFEKDKPSNKEDLEKYVAKYNQIKDKMFMQMESVSLIDSPDSSYLKQMIYHHHGAVAMAKNLLKYTQNPELIKLAQNIVQSQNQDIKKMKQLLKSIN